MPTVGSLFSGIGGLDLGFERAGFEVRWMCERDPYCRSVLTKHWPGVPIYEDVRSIRGTTGEAAEVLSVTHAQRRNGRANHEGAKAPGGNGPAPSSVVEPIDVLIGGFPCQDISLAGKGAGLDGERSGLWWEFYRLIGELRPRYVCLENVAPLVVRGLPAILGALSRIGYDAEWTIVSAASVGAPHLRERLFLVAYPHGRGDENGVRLPAGEREGLSDAYRVGGRSTGTRRENVADAEGQPGDDGEERPAPQRDGDEWRGWAVEPDVGRVAYGVPRRVDRLRGLGNAVVPAVAEYVARCIMDHLLRNI